MDQRHIDLLAIESFEWVIEEGADGERILSDTYAANLVRVEDLRRQIARSLEPSRVTFHDIGGCVWARTEYRPT